MENFNDLIKDTKSSFSEKEAENLKLFAIASKAKGFDGIICSLSNYEIKQDTNGTTSGN